MQAKLHPAEFAYLLQMLDARKVVGVNNAQFFPDDAAARDALLKLGFSKLQEHGWFVPTNGKIKTNNHLVLLAAVAANPDRVLTATYFAADDSRRSITYYSAGKLILEQFLAADGDYLLTQLESLVAIERRLVEAFALPEDSGQAGTTLTFAAEIFEQALRQAKAGDLAFLKTLLTGQVSPDVLAETAHTLARLQPLGKIEAAAITGQRLQAWREFALLAAEAERPWLARRNDDNRMLELAPADQNRFEQFFQEFVMVNNMLHSGLDQF